MHHITYAVLEVGSVLVCGVYIKIYISGSERVKHWVSEHTCTCILNEHFEFFSLV